MVATDIDGVARQVTAIVIEHHGCVPEDNAGDGVRPAAAMGGAGAGVTGFFGFGPTIGASFNITLICYRDTCDIGVNVDTSAVPDSDVLLECLREGFEEVIAIG